MPTVEQPPSPYKPAVAESQAQTAQPDPYQFRDLKAQEDMAYWAMWMFIAAVFTFAVTSIGTFLIWRQVRLTRQAVEDTGEATKAMKDANRIARGAARSAHHRNLMNESRVKEAERRQLRAYVTAAETKAEQIQTANGIIWEIQVVWQNNGATPALNVFANANITTFGGDLPGDFDFPDNHRPSQVAPIPIGPAQFLYCRAPQVNGSTFVDVSQGLRRLFIWGWVDYEDIFAIERRRTEFCHEIRVDYAEKKFGMAFIPYGRHNGMDDGCMKQPRKRG